MTSSDTQKTHYDILGVASTASYDEIKGAYHKYARELRPDKQQQRGITNTRNDDGQVPKDFKRIQSAWETLRNSGTRKDYDDDLKQKSLRLQSRSNGAIELLEHELEEAIDEETEETIFVYDCRCGEEVVIIKRDQPEQFVDCEGCCFVYKVCKTSNNNTDDTRRNTFLQ